MREYLAALDARERGLSPFAKLAATVKLARLRREMDAVALEATDEDVAILRREVADRLNQSFVRRFEAKPWGARLSLFLMMVLGQQLVLALVLLATMLFVRFAPVPAWWNPNLPREEPVFLYLFIFFFLFSTPMLALMALFGGRFFRSWRKTVPATMVILLISVIGVFITVRGEKNPVQQPDSLALFTKERGLNVPSYNQWKDANWLMNDPKFQRDYEAFLRNGPGRWITSRFDAKEDRAWKDSLPVMNEYLDGGQDPASFSEWLKYYLDRNRIYSEDRIDQVAAEITGPANQRFLGIWQTAPFLKERDERMYRAYMGRINRRMKLWGLVNLGLMTLAFLLIYLLGPALSAWERMAVRLRVRVKSQPSSMEPDYHDAGGSEGRLSRLKEQYYSFPERREITTPAFFDTPFKLLARVHRSFVGLAVFTSIFVFCFWGVVYAIDLAAGHENAPSQTALMRSHLIFGGPADAGITTDDQMVAEANDQVVEQHLDYAALPAQPPKGFAPGSREAALAARVVELELLLDEANYHTNKEFKQKDELIASQHNELDLLKNLTTQIQQTTSALPDQVADVNSRIGAVEARAGQAASDVSVAKQQAEAMRDQLGAKIDDVEKRAARVADQIGEVEETASQLATRTDALEKELDERARQIEARTEELGERTASLKEREEHLNRLQGIAFAAILANIKTDVEGLEQRTSSTFYRLFNKGEARRDAEALSQRISSLKTRLREMNSEQANELTRQLEEYGKRIDAISERIK